METVWYIVIGGCAAVLVFAVVKGCRKPKQRDHSITVQGKRYRFNPYEETPVEKRFPVDADRYIENPVSVPVDFVLSLVGWDKADYYADKATAAILRGGKFVVMPNADYVRAQEFLNSKKQR